MLDEKTKQLRRTGLGGSDLAAICGLSPSRTPLDIYLQKTSDNYIDIINDQMYIGSKLEPVIADLYQKKTGYSIEIEPETLRHPNLDFAIANIDRWVNNKEFILECKSASYFAKDDWGLVNTNEIPIYYLTQVAWYGFVCNKDRVDIALLINTNDFRIYRYDRDARLEEKLVKIATHFWNHHVKTRIPPNPINHADNLKLYPEDNGVSIIANSEIIEKIKLIRDYKEKSKELDIKIAKLRTEIEAFMTDCSTLVDSKYRPIATWKTTEPRKIFNSKILKDDDPKLYEKYLRETKPSRVFIIKGLKEEGGV